MRSLLICLIIFSATLVAVNCGKEEEKEAKAWLKSLEPELNEACRKNTKANWDFATNITEEHEKVKGDSMTELSAFQSTIQMQILDKFPDWREFKDKSVKRQFRELAMGGPGTMEPEKVEEMTTIQGQMESAFAKATVCEYNNPDNCDFHLDPEITEKLQTSEDFDETAHYWTAWHDAVGKGISPQTYTKFIALQNEQARANGVKDASEIIIMPYDNGKEGWTADTFKEDMRTLWNTVKPYYAKLHAYVRMKLRAANEVYGERIPQTGPIPANVLGNMWGQDWSSLEQLTRPFPDAPSVDATTPLKKQGFTAKRIYEEADKFFSDMGLMKVDKNFWAKSMLEKPKDGRDVVCHGSADDFCNGDVRIKMCTSITSEHLVVVHHELGHVQYYMQYKKLPFSFRGGANPGFHEAIGDSLAMAVQTPTHLQCILGLKLGLDFDCDAVRAGTQPVSDITDTDINFLFGMALGKLAFFGFAISMDSWRWEVMDGTTTEEDYNKRWWQIRFENQGIAPPTPRPDDTFDPAAKFHIPTNVEYIRYFVSSILTFQFYEGMCKAAGKYKPKVEGSAPLFQCDFSGNKKAGKKLGNMMKMGYSKPWPAALKAVYGSGELTFKPLTNYFQPLFDKLDADLEAAGETPGWE